MEDEEYGKYIVRKITTLLREVIHDGTESIDNLKFIIKKTDTFVYQNYGMYSISAPFKNVKFHNISAQEIRNLIESSETSIDFIKNLIINAAKYEGEIKDTDNSSTFRITQRMRDIIIPISNFISYNRGIAKDIIKKNEERLSSPSPIMLTPVPQTSVTSGANATGRLSATGIHMQKGQGFVKSFSEHCLILGLVCV